MIKSVKMSRLVLSPVFLLILCLKRVAGCGEINTPVIRMCYNNSVAFLSTGYATSEDSPAGARDCSCIISTEVSDILLRVTWETSASFVTGCQSTRIKLIPTKGFKAELDCSTTQHNTKYSISNVASLSQVLVKRMDYPVCLKYQVDNGPGKVTVTCQGDELPTTKTAQATTAIPLTPTHMSTTPSTSAGTTPVKTSPSDETTTTTKVKSTDVTASNTESGPESTNELSFSTSGFSNSSTNGNLTFSTNRMTEMSDLNTTGVTSNSSTGNEYVTTERNSEITSMIITTPSSPPDGDEDELAKIIAGSVVGGIAFIIIVILIIVCILRRRRTSKWNRVQKVLTENSLYNKAFDEGTERIHTFGGKSGELGKKIDDVENEESIVGITHPVQESEPQNFSDLYSKVEKIKLQDSDTLY